MITGWPRKPHDHGNPGQGSPPTTVGESRNNDSEGNNRGTSPDPTRRRSSSDSATPKQTPVPPSLRILSSSASGIQPESSRSHLFSLSDAPSSLSSSSRKLGLFTDKLSHLAGHHHHGHGYSVMPKPSSLNPALLLHPHGRNPEPLGSPTSPTFPPSPTMSNPNKVHTSPSKASYGRTYDSKLVTREMHRLGNLAHLPSGIPALSQAPSVSSLSLPAPGAMAQASMASTSGSDPWGTLHVHILPLFNGEPLRIPIENLNMLVKAHIATAASSPSKALATLEHDTSELIGSGMRTLNAKLAEKEDDKLVGRIVEIWGFFWDQVLPYVEGALLPLQTDPLLSSLYRTPKRPSSPSRQNNKGSISTSLGASLQLSTQHIDVRAVALRSFRDKVILPLAPRLKARLSMVNRQDNFQETTGYQQPRLQQMLLVLTSQSRYRTPTFSLTAQPPQPSTGEAAVLELLRILRSPTPQFDGRQTVKPSTGRARAPSFLSGGLPRDRRGRIAQKQKGASLPNLVSNTISAGDDGDSSGGETPRIGSGGTVVEIEREREREKEREFLEALRSPDPESSNARASVGGWGLGMGHEDSGKIEEEEDEPLDWDQAQAVVERMIGMNSSIPESATRKRVT
ncbi:HbrB-domain-containing protein [Armillaria gallica]|uniref:HbrB-domain-containing protein n=1 Tax=Armillaria gallica TaxID=47427 RepID=A0A2H3E722_ARMGA|nr:HbrB-domain-containing protein [Armillaria gallica]